MPNTRRACVGKVSGEPCSWLCVCVQDRFWSPGSQLQSRCGRRTVAPVPARLSLQMVPILDQRLRQWSVPMGPAQVGTSPKSSVLLSMLDQDTKMKTIEIGLYDLRLHQLCLCVFVYTVNLEATKFVLQISKDLKLFARLYDFEKQNFLYFFFRAFEACFSETDIIRDIKKVTGK